MANCYFALAIVVLAELTVSVRAGVPKQCSAMPECHGLQGNCCPNADGVQLDCCILAGVRIKAEDAKKAAQVAEAKAKAAVAAADKATAAAKKAEAKAKKEGAQANYVKNHIAESKCQNNAGCKKLGLTGFCCPNLDGTTLGCCGDSEALAEDATEKNSQETLIEDEDLTIGDSVANTNASSSLAEWFSRRRRYYGGYRRRGYYGGYRRRRYYGGYRRRRSRARCQYCPYSYSCHSNSGRRYRCHPSTPYYFRGRCYRRCPSEVDDLAATEKNSQETLIEDEDLTNEDDEDDEEEGEEEVLNSAPQEEPTTEFGTSMWIAFVGGVVGAVISASVAVRWRPRTIVQTPILGA